MVISLANLLFQIRLDDKDKKLLAKFLGKNREFTASVQMTEKELDVKDIAVIERVLNRRYKFRAY